MKTILVKVVIVSALRLSSVSQMLPTWDNWVLPSWSPSWSFNSAWSAPSPIPGFARNVIGSSSDPADNYFNLRSNHYLWTNTTDARYKYICGPETYLNANGVCSKNPRYWNISSSALDYCIPDKITNTSKFSCQNVYAANPSLLSSCCYKSSTDDLKNIYRLATTYPPGA